MVYGTIFFCLSSLTTVNVAVLNSYRLFTDPWSSWDSFHSRCFMPWVRNNLPTKISQHQILRIIVSMAPHVCKKFLFGFKYTVRKWIFCVLVHFVKRIVGLPLFVKHLWLDKIRTAEGGTLWRCFMWWLMICQCKWKTAKIKVLKSSTKPSQQSLTYWYKLLINSLGNNDLTWTSIRQTRSSLGLIMQEFSDTKVHDDVIKWIHFPRYWPFARGIHRSQVNPPHKGQWRGALMFSLICVWINGWVINDREAGDLRHYRAHYAVTVMSSSNFIPNKILANNEGQNTFIIL